MTNSDNNDENQTSNQNASHLQQRNNRTIIINKTPSTQDRDT